ncbi:endonuclease/exonuclease/phosphatase family protein [Aurantimonas sp. C2-6-R+9]|uniref:endonuclease/exonuclease/phosphatase family protein n=1 Tax=unclassified Aurantimonas TaxID=2638230 RepID=UPI002E18F646|nr:MULTISPECIES: endonuclease/exonuclease/phosphatase family protein [unclassified Aurantimonas]MEC5292893.1 endonuclease/exonuclease/phosphatase family protein [Aurantimonas sp. C2-3-R2]MEC5383102.1 endonuclease/exonuclease/phosphatase family protein [Aurantimonas sp. C2-6-R+9]MEC5413943.1 endonuclease/exonuclease/phosphatase family protein [Aurantimonas sp. C2-4-R8]
MDRRLPIATLIVVAFMGSAYAQSGSSQPGAETLTVAAWNLEHLTEQSGTGCKARSEADYEELRQYAEALDADVIAFQEVENEAAAARVLPADDYVIVIEQRQGSDRRTECFDADGQYLVRQAVGFAIRRDLPLDRNPDLTALQLGDRDLRSAVDITLRPENGQPLRLLSVHLKSGCARGESGRDCEILLQQQPALIDWIRAREREKSAYALLGDFNRNLDLQGDRVWAELTEANELDLAVRRQHQ